MFRNSLRPTLIGFATPTLLGVAYASAAGPYEITVARWRDAARRYLSSKCRRKIPRPAAADAFDKTGSISFGVKAAQRGYVAVIQGVRGRFRSEGDWYPFKYESQDGYDAIEGAAALPHSNGKIGMFGGSYVGATQIPYCDRLAASAGHLPGGDGVELSRRLDVSGRGVRAVVRRIVDDGTGDEHNAAPRGIERQPAASGRTFCRSHPIPRSRPSVEKAPRLTSKMAGASELRRLLEAVGNRRALQADSRAGIFDRRLVRHFSWRIAAELYAAEERSRHKKRGAGGDCTSRPAGMRAAAATSRFTSGFGIPICHKMSESLSS